TGDGSIGVRVRGETGVVVEVGRVSTSGGGTLLNPASRGINAEALAGNVSISAAEVETAGDEATGIYASAGGDIVIDVGAVTTTGWLATGINAITSAGSITITAGDVTTGVDGLDDPGDPGHGSHGIVATSIAGDVTVQSSGTITAFGESAQGVAASSVDGAVTVSTTAISTSGTAAQGIEADSLSG